MQCTAHTDVQSAVLAVATAPKATFLCMAIQQPWPHLDDKVQAASAQVFNPGHTMCVSAQLT